LFLRHRLTAGILFGLSFAHPYISESRGIARILLQVSVVALGFGMNLHEVLKAGRSGFVYTSLGISFALVVGVSIGRLLQVRGNSSFLIATGTMLRQSTLGADEATALVITDTQQAGLQPPKYAFAPQKKRASPVSILHLLVRHIGRAAVKL
jgi:hypothetical protein